MQKANFKVLVVPLDWGLGHTTRCIPIIKHLVNTGCDVLLAAEGPQKALLQMEFPQLLVITVAGYNIRYAKSKRLLPIKILSQLPKIWRSIKKEHRWLQQTVTDHGINAVISDNRYGLWHSTVPSVFITHQLHIKVGIKWLEKILRSLNYQLVNRFTACWVPDFEHQPNLAGTLSHPTILPAIPVKFLGALSRFEMGKNVDKKYDLLIIISGPEPQRTLLEGKLLADVKDYSGSVLFVRGLPGSQQNIPSFNHVEIVNHLEASQLNLAFQQSELIISRAGYTTVMDIVKLQKKSILIPTPGQTEQEFLATHLNSQHIALSFDQSQFSLPVALEKAARFEYSFPEMNMDDFKSVLDDFVQSMRR